MPSLDTIRRITIQGRTEGVDQATASIKKLADAQGNVVSISERTERSTRSVQSALDRQQRSLDSNYAATQSFAKAQKDLDAARAQGLISAERHSELLGLATTKYGQASGAAKVFSEATKSVSGQLIALSAGAGPVGTFLAGLGPWGVAAAVGIGALSKAFSSLSDSAREFAQKTAELRKFADVTQLTTQQVQALRSEAAKFGVTSEDATTAIEQFSARFNDLRLGSGPLLEAVRRVDAALADQMQRTTDTAEALTLLGQALQKTSDVFQRNELVKAAAGRGGIGASQFLTGLDVNKTTAIYTAAGKGIDEQIIRKIPLIAIEIEKTNKQAEAILQTMFTPATQSFEKFLADSKLSWAQWLKERQSDAQQFGLSLYRRLFPSRARFVMPTPEEYATPATVLPPAGLGQKTPEAILAQSRANIAALGQAATQTEQYKNKVLELEEAVRKQGASKEAAARGEARYRQEQILSNEAAKEALGVANQTEIESAKIMRLQLQVADGLKLTNEQRQTAVQIIKLESRAAAESAQIRASALPGLKAMALEYANMNKMIDQFGTAVAGQFVSAMSDLIMRTNSAADAFRNFGLAVLRTLSEIVVKMAVVQPIVAGFTGAFSGGLGITFQGIGLPSAKGNVFDRSGLVESFQYGGMIDRPTVAVAGESGPEAIIPLRRGADGRLGVTLQGRGGGGSVVNYAPVIDARGADAAAVARLAAVLAQDRKDFAKNVLEITNSARSNNPSYLRRR